MKKTSPNYRKVNPKDVFNGLTKKNQRIINDFLKYCEITSNYSKTQLKIKYKVMLLADILEKDLDSLKLKDLVDFLTILKGSYQSPSTKEDVLKQVKRFLKWKYEDYPKRFKEFTDIKNFNKYNISAERISVEDLLTQHEFEQIINSISDLKLKTMLTLLYVSACRPEEIEKLTFAKIDSRKETINVFSNKTKRARTIPIKEAMPQLNRYIKECFDNINPSDYIFSDGSDNKNHVKKGYLSNRLSKLQFDLKFKKRLFPYIFRHTRLNIWLKKLPTDVYEKVAGHSISVALKTYSHLNVDIILNTFEDKIYGVEELTIEEKDKIINLELKIKEQDKRFKDFELKMLDVIENNFKERMTDYLESGKPGYHEKMKKEYKKRFPNAK